MKRWLALLPIVVLVALAVFLMTQMDRMAGDPAAGPTYRPDALVGQPIPETTVLPILVDGKASDDISSLTILLSSLEKNPGRRTRNKSK